MKYTKRGNQKWFNEELRQKSFKRLNSIKINLKRNEDASNAKNNKNILKKKSFTNKNIDNRKIFNKTTFSNFGNTIRTVKNEAQFIKNIRENFDIKRKTVNNFLKSNSLPILNENVERKSIKKNNKILSPSTKKEKKTSLMFDLKRNNKDFDDDNDKKLNDIYNAFKNTFYSKIKSWSKEEDAKKEIQKKEDEIYQNNKKYMNEIKGIKRKANLFIDVYSLRDGVVNERIKLFNRSLNGPIYSKNNMNDKINDFNNYIDCKEKERLTNEELFRQKQIEEEKKLKEEDIHYQVMQKMIKNLNMNNKIKKEEENIDFNYRYIPSIKNQKLKDIVSQQAFKDYLESLKFVKKKEKLLAINNE